MVRSKLTTREILHTGFALVLQSQLMTAVLEDESSSGSHSDLNPMLRDTASSRPAQAPGVSQLLDQVNATLAVALCKNSTTN